MGKSNAAKVSPASRPRLRAACAADGVLSAFNTALTVYQKHTAEIMAPAEAALTAARESGGRGPLPPNWLRIEDDNSTLFNEMADAEEALMRHRGVQLEDVYARLVGLWSFQSRGSIDRTGKHIRDDREEEETLAVRLSLDAVAGMIGRPGAAHYQFYK